MNNTSVFTSSGVKIGAWTEEEDLLLRKCIEIYGEGKWHQVPARAGLNRCRKSCRLRWLNYLRPHIKRGDFSSDEVDLILRLHKLLGNRWSLIAGRLPGRTANDVKNYWNTNLQRKFKISPHRYEKQRIRKCKAINKNTIIRPQPRTLSISMKKNVSWYINKSITNGTEDSKGKMIIEKPLVTAYEDDNVQWWASLLANNCNEFAAGNTSSPLKNSSEEDDDTRSLSYEEILPTISKNGTGTNLVQVGDIGWSDFSDDADLIWDLLS